MKFLKQILINQFFRSSPDVKNVLKKANDLEGKLLLT